MDIQWEKSGPVWVSEADATRGADAFEESIRGDLDGYTTGESGLALVAAADRLRGEDYPVAPALISILDRAGMAAEEAITTGWRDRTADSGVTYRIDVPGDVPGNIAQLMDDDIREALHDTATGDAADFIAAYAMALQERTGETFPPLTGEAW